MKKILFTIAVQIFVAKFAFSQSGTGSNSDWKVPVPVISPQIETATLINLITVPNIPTISAAPFSLGPTIAPQNLVPSVPNMPSIPPIPTQAIPGIPVGQLKMKFSIQQILPPLPPIPTSPSVKMPVI